MIDNKNIQSSVYESFNNKWTGYVILPFLLQECQTEIMIFWILALGSPRGLAVWNMEIQWATIFYNLVITVKFC